jgi:hypothetical protein
MTELTDEQLAAIRKRTEDGLAYRSYWYDSPRYSGAVFAGVSSALTVLHDDVPALLDALTAARAEVAHLTALITAPDGGRIPLPLLDELQTIAAESGCHHRSAVAVVAETAYAVGSEHVDDLKAEVQRRGETNTLLAQLNTEVHRELEQARQQLAECHRIMAGGVVVTTEPPTSATLPVPAVPVSAPAGEPEYLSVDGVPYRLVTEEEIHCATYRRMSELPPFRIDQPLYRILPAGIAITRDLAERMAAGLPADEPTPEQRARFETVPAPADDGLALPWYSGRSRRSLTEPTPPPDYRIRDLPAR